MQLLRLLRPAMRVLYCKNMITPLLPVSELFSHTWQQFIVRIRTFIKFGLCAFALMLIGAFSMLLTAYGNAVVGFIISVVGGASTQPSAFAISLAQTARASAGYIGAVLLIAFVLTILVLMASYLRIAFNEPNVTIKQLLREGLACAIPILCAAILVEIIVAVGTALFVIPGIIAYVFLLFTILAAAQGSGPVNALKKSYGLVKGRWWQVLGRMICAMLAVMAYFVVLIICGTVSVSIIRTSVGLGIFMSIISLGALLIGYVFTGPWMLMYMRTLMKDLERVGTQAQ